MLMCEYVLFIQRHTCSGADGKAAWIYSRNDWKIMLIIGTNTIFWVMFFHLPSARRGTTVNGIGEECERRRRPPFTASTAKQILRARIICDSATFVYLTVLKSHSQKESLWKCCETWRKWPCTAPQINHFTTQIVKTVYSDAYYGQIRHRFACHLCNWTAVNEVVAHIITNSWQSSNVIWKYLNCNLQQVASVVLKSQRRRVGTAPASEQVMLMIIMIIMLIIKMVMTPLALKFTTFPLGIKRPLHCCDPSLLEIVFISICMLHT